MFYFRGPYITLETDPVAVVDNILLGVCTSVDVEQPTIFHVDRKC
jgi:hypothetical protein